MTNKQVAELMGCSEKTVERANVAYRQNRQNKTDETDTDRQTDGTRAERQKIEVQARPEVFLSS